MRLLKASLNGIVALLAICVMQLALGISDARAQSVSCTVTAADFVPPPALAPPADATPLAISNPGTGAISYLFKSDDLYLWAEQRGNAVAQCVEDVDFGETNDEFLVWNGSAFEFLTPGGKTFTTTAGGTIRGVNVAGIGQDTIEYTPPSPSFSGTDTFYLNDSGGNTTGLAMVITVGPPPPPTVTGLSPAAGAAGTTTPNVVITGTNFTGTDGATGVMFGGTSAVAYTVNSATQITATAPSLAAGVVDVVVTRGSASATSAASKFTYVSPPTISAAFSPTTITTAETSTLTLTISNPNSSLALSGVAVAAAALPVNLAGSGASTTCSGGTATYDGGTRALSLSGGSLAASASCTVTLAVSSTTATTYNYTTGTVSASGPAPITGLTATTPTALTVTALPAVSIAVAPASASEDGSTNLTYTVTRSAASASPLTVNLTTGGAATSGVDYAGSVATATILANATTTTVVIDPAVDSTVEPDETVILTVDAGTGYTVGAPSSATGTILNDDVPAASIAVSPASTAEDGVGNLVYTVTLDQAPIAATTVNFTVGGTATSGTDFAAVGTTASFAIGVTTSDVTVNPVTDATAENDETAVLTLASGTGYTVGAPNAATGTILNDDQPDLSINNVTLSEGASGTTNATFTVSLSAPAGAGGVTFDIGTANGAAIAGGDYVSNTLTGQTIPQGSSTYDFTVLVNGDALDETNETFFVNVTNVTGAIVTDGQGLGTINDDDATPSLSINDVTLTEGDTGTSLAVFTVSLSAASGQTVTVNHATADGSAQTPGDYAAASGTLTLNPGDTTQTVSVTVNGDTTVELDETFTVGLSGPSNATIADGSGAGTIANDDFPSASIALSPASVAEDGATSLTYTITLDRAPAAATTVNFTVGGAATNGTDYGTVTTSRLFSPGDTTATIDVDPIADAAIEADETVVITLAAGTGYTIGAPSAQTGTIANDDLPALSIDDVAVAEGDAGTMDATFTVSLSAPALAGGVAFDIQAADNTALAGQDYVARSLTAQSIAEGASSYTFTVQVTGDLIDELNEGFLVNVAGVTGATVADAQGVGAITDDDAAPTINISSPSIVEGNSGSANVGVAFTLTAASGLTITAGWQTGGGTATAGSDYTSSSGTVTFTPGQQTQTVDIPVLGDGAVELDETFTVDFAAAPTNAVGGAAGTVTIQNDDQPDLAVNDVSLAEGDAGTTAFTFTISLSAPAPAGGVAFDIATAAGTATAGTDFATNSATGRTIAAGASSASFIVLVNGDTLNEPDETFLVNVANVTGAIATDSQGQGTIANDDAAPGLSVSDVSVTEGDAGTTNAVFTVALSAASGQTVSVNFATADGAATAGVDYVAQSGVLSFPPGVTSRTVSVAVNGDIAIEPDETFTLDLSGATNAAVADGSGVGTVLADDFAPSITVLTPASGLRAGGTAVTITGAALTGATAVSFGGTAATSFTVDSDSQISAVASAGLGTVDVGVVTAKGASVPSGATQYIYVASTVSGLSNLTLSQGSLTPGFATGTPGYAAAVANAVTSITVTPTVVDATSVVRVNGVVVASGAASGAIALAVGANTVAVVVTAQDGATTSSYSVQVTRAQSAVSTLADLTLSTGALSPAFTSGVTGYAASVGNGVTSITLTPTVTDATAVVTVNGATVASGAASGAIPLNVGANAITTVVTAQDGVTTTTYTTTVTRAGSAVSSLSALTLSSGPISPAFTPGVTGYAASVPNATASVTLTAMATQPDATLTVNGAPVVSGATSGPISLNLGDNTLTVLVTAQDGVTTTTYAVIVTRGEAAPVAGPASLSVAYNAAATSVPLVLSGGPTVLVAVASAPAHGAVVVSGATATYQPAAGFSGGDSFTYTATGPGGTSAPAVVTVTVGAPAVVVGPPTLAAGQRGVAYNQTATGAGGQGPYTFAVTAGALPAGLTLSPAGVLSGAPQASGSFNLTITATDSSTGAGPFSASQAYVLTVAAPVVTLSPPAGALPGGTVGVVYSQAISAAGAVAPYSFAVTGGALPAGLTLAADGTLSGAPTTSGAFSFTVTATDAATAGSGGPYSASTTWSLAIGDTAPVAGASSLSVGYGAGATAVPLTLSGGPTTSVAVATAPTRGTTQASGATIVYTPGPGVYGNDSFTYTAAGPGGISAPATVTVTIVAPTLTITPTTLPDGQEDVVYSATLTPSGGTAPYTLAVAGGALPSGLTLSSAGVLSGTPTADGDYAFTLTVTDSSTGSGPASASQAFTLRIALPPPPVAQPSPGVINADGGASGGEPVGIDLSALVTGDYDEIRIVAPPQHGAVVLEVGAVVTAAAASGSASPAAGPRVTAVYTAAAGYVGPDGFSFVAAGPGGVSAPARVSISVVGLNPTAANLTATTEQGRPVTVDLTGAATEGPFTAAAIVSATPAGAATTVLIQGGPADARTYALTVTPRADFEGDVVVTYTISNSIGVSAPATVTVAVQPRPDPADDPTVRALTTAQAQAARLFATTQLGNFNRRNEQLHDPAEGRGQALGVSVSSGLAGLSNAPMSDLPWVEREHQLAAERDASLTDLPDRADPFTEASDRALGVARSRAQESGADHGSRVVGSVSVWSGGAVTVGGFDQTTRTADFDITTSGVSAGADVKLSDQLIIGAGGGFGAQRTDIGEDEAGRLDGEGWTGAIYSSWRPAPGAFIDGVLGYGALDFDTRRMAVNGRIANGEREGDMVMASITAGWDRPSPLATLSTYGRFDYVSTTLDAYAETGADLYNLAFAERKFDSLTGALGVRGERLRQFRSGVLTQSGRIEWRHEFSGLDGQSLDYADIGGFRYVIDGERWMRDEVSAELGLEMIYDSGLTLGIDIGARFSNAAAAATLRLLLAKRF